MPDTPLQVLAIGNAIVDVIARADDAFLAAEGLDKGGMRLIGTDDAEALYGRMGTGIEASGGSAANTVAGLAAMGVKAGFVGQVADDVLGRVFAHDIRALGVQFETPSGGPETPTARCLILVTPDGQRTMNTYLGAAQLLDEAALDRDAIAAAEILYLEGYLWDPEAPKAAMRAAIEIARANGRRIAFSLSDAFCIARHRDEFRALIDGGLIDILFANEAEITSLAELDGFDAAVDAIAPKVPLLVVTRGGEGAIAVAGAERAAVAAEPVTAVVDTTGAGDLFAAGFLAGQAQQRSLQDSLQMGAIAAAEIISHYGARPEADLNALIAAKLG